MHVTAMRICILIFMCHKDRTIENGKNKSDKFDYLKIIKLNRN